MPSSTRPSAVGGSWTRQQVLVLVQDEVVPAVAVAVVGAGVQGQPVAEGGECVGQCRV